MIFLAAALAICPPQGVRYECLHDADTAWIAGEKLRIENIDAPELKGRCAYEIDLAYRARDRMLELLNSGEIVITRSGRVDRYGRPLVRLSVGGRDLGEQLVSEGLARRWNGGREPWCD